MSSAAPTRDRAGPARSLWQACLGAAAVLACAAAGQARAAAATTGPATGPAIVAAEAVYGDIARQIAGPDAPVTSLLTNPAADPHLYEPGPGAARAVAGAAIAIANGAGYEPWFDRLTAGHVAVLRVATLIGAPAGANPHLWVDPRSGPALARALAARLAQLDPAHADAYRARCAAFLASLAPLDASVERLHRSVAARATAQGHAVAVTATEPVLGPLLDALGIAQADPGVQRAAMNDTEPGPAAVASLQSGLDAHRVAALVFNAQVISPLSTRLRARAQAAGVPTISVSETLPSGLDYQGWMRQLVDATAHAIGTDVAAR